MITHPALQGYLARIICLPTIIPTETGGNEEAHVTWFVDFDYDFTTVACATTLANLRHSPMLVRLRGDTSVGRRPLASATSPSVKNCMCV